MVEGTNHRLGLFSSIDVFEGIPFTAPPGRFERPKPHPAWEGVLKATKYQKRCLQVTLMQTGIHGSEDCLYLNIWDPHGRKVSTNLPVMIDIFGGAFLLGASNDVSFMENSLCDGEEVTKRGNVTMVMVNYHVGILGFLSTGDARGPGNYGLWDQYAAIAWVHRNIRSFGGDPENITIFGQSAGSASASFQMLPPYNRGLFHQAISQCGVALSPEAMQRDPLALAQVAERVGCPIGEEMMACLKITDLVALGAAGKLALGDIGKGPVVYLLELSPVVDGDFIPDHPSNFFHNAADIDYIAGTSSMDGHLFAGMDVPSINQKRKPTYPEDIKKLLAGLTRDRGELAVTSSFSTYIQSWVPETDQKTIKQTEVDIETDYLFLVPTLMALHLHASNAQSADAYSYIFSMPTWIPSFPSWVEADHAEDVQYVFAKPFSSHLIYFPHHLSTSLMTSLGTSSATGPTLPELGNCGRHLLPKAASELQPCCLFPNAILLLFLRNNLS